jgi:hypothetical protein
MILTIAWREFRSMFLSPLAWVIRASYFSVVFFLGS